jgi:hypothetical protein
MMVQQDVWPPNDIRQCRPASCKSISWSRKQGEKVMSRIRKALAAFLGLGVAGFSGHLAPAGAEQSRGRSTEMIALQLEMAELSRWAGARGDQDNLQ